MKIRVLSFFGVVGLFAICAPAVNAQSGGERLTQLPQDHEYQTVLRDYMATLTEHDFEHGVTGRLPLDTPTSQDPEYLYRQYILTLTHQPLVGTKRGVPSVNAPPELFLLSAIERPEGVMEPMVWPETLMAFVEWDYPGNLYRDNRALKLRAFVGGAVQMMLFHNFAERNDGKTPPPIRPDWHGYVPVYFAAAYPGFKEVLPPEVRKAFETGLKMVGERMLKWGVRGESCESDLMAPLGLVYISRAIKDPEFTQAVEERVRLVCTDPRYIHPAGYWVERGGIDMGFGGTANLYATWIALMTDWPFAREAVERAYRLRGHLILPEPDGTLVGPGHFNSRLGSTVACDQFACDGTRDIAASMVTDEAFQFIGSITGRDHTKYSPEVLKAAPGRRAFMFNEDIGENPRIREADGSLRHIRSDEIKLGKWGLRMWWTHNFPISVNPGYEFYRDGAFAHRQELEKNNAAMFKSPFLRGENFIRDFAQAFVVTRQPGFAAILHTGPVGAQTPDDKKFQFAGPLGLGGGQLSAFWTPETGTVLLGQRSGMSYDQSFDKLDAWRTWPQHAISGVTASGKIFSSGRCAQPETETEVQNNRATVRVSGSLVAMKLVDDGGQEAKGAALYDDTIEGQIGYSRAFKMDEKGVSVKTTVSGDGQDSIAELYEMLPVFLHDAQHQADTTPTAIEFQSGGAWTTATAQSVENVQAVRLTRFCGSVMVTFDKPQRVKLSPANWSDTWFTKAVARNVLIDLLDSGGQPEVVQGSRIVAYRIEAAVQ